MTAWHMHVVGPDDLFDAADMLDAMRQAQKLNAFILEDMERDGVGEHTPLCWAIPCRRDSAGECER